MSKNSRHGQKMSKKFEMQEKQRRERIGLPTAVQRAPQTEGAFWCDVNVAENPDQRDEYLRRLSQSV